MSFMLREQVQLVTGLRKKLMVILEIKPFVYADKSSQMYIARFYID
ncbi:hypothetical protein [Campylobacter sp. CCUG 57310]|nr:hypothetical protein [Campylobacter sp. CCUG 57310]